MPDFFAFGLIVAAVIWIVRSVLKPGLGDTDGRRAAGKVAEAVREMREQSPWTPQGARPAPQAGPRPGVRTSPVSRRPQSALRKPGPAPRTTSPRETSLDAWHLVLDVSADASRREIQDAVKLRLSRARADRDPEAARRVLRAAATGLRR